MQDASRVVAINQWQTSSDQKLRNTIVKQRFEDLKARREVGLDARRAKLASKLMREDAALKQELIESQEKPEERRAKLADRARQLASRREAERQELAATLLNRAFNEGCDVLRETNSKRVLYRTLEERTAQVEMRVPCMGPYLPSVFAFHYSTDVCRHQLVQIEQKMAAKIVEEEEKRMFFEMNEQQRLKAMQRLVHSQATARLVQPALRVHKVAENFCHIANLLMS